MNSSQSTTVLQNATGKQEITPLMQACQSGKESAVRQLIIKDPNSIRDRDKTGKTAVHYCVENNSLSCIEQVVSLDPSLLASRDEDGYSPLHLATIAGNSAVVKFLLSKGADIHARDNENHTAVHWATVCGEVDILDMLMDAGADASTPDIHGAYPIHYAAQMCGPNSELGHDVNIGLLILHKLLQRGVDVTVRDHDGRQPLLWAASAEVRPSHVYCPSGSPDAILALVNAKADVTADDKDGLTALHCAASRGHLDCLEVLINFCNAEVDILDTNGCTPLFYSVTLGHADCTEFLMRHGSVPDRQDRKGRTPAHCGAAKGQLETLKLLHRRGADMWKKNIKGDLPLHEACQSGRGDLVLWLLSLRMETINAPNHDGRCPLHIAAINNNVQLCKILMDQKANVNSIMRNSKGQLLTPVDAALAKGNKNCAQYLQLHGGLPASKLTDKRALQAAMNQALNTGPSGHTGATPTDIDEGIHTPSTISKTPISPRFTPSVASQTDYVHFARESNVEDAGYGGMLTGVAADNIRDLVLAEENLQSNIHTGKHDVRDFSQNTNDEVLDSRMSVDAESNKNQETSPIRSKSVQKEIQTDESFMSNNSPKSNLQQTDDQNSNETISSSQSNGSKMSEASTIIKAHSTTLESNSSVSESQPASSKGNKVTDVSIESDVKITEDKKTKRKQTKTKKKSKNKKQNNSKSSVEDGDEDGLNVPRREPCDGASEEGDSSLADSTTKNVSKNKDAKSKNKANIINQKTDADVNTSNDNVAKNSEASDSEDEETSSSSESESSELSGDTAGSADSTEIENENNKSHSTQSRKKIYKASVNSKSAQQSSDTTDERTHEMLLESSTSNLGLLQDVPIATENDSLDQQSKTQRSEYKEQEEENNSSGSEVLSEGGGADKLKKSTIRRKRVTKRQTAVMSLERPAALREKKFSQTEKLTKTEKKKKTREGTVTINDVKKRSGDESDSAESSSSSSEDENTEGKTKNGLKVTKSTRKSRKRVKVKNEENIKSSDETSSKVASAKRAMSGGPRKVETMDKSLKKSSRDPPTEVSITQAMQSTMRKYALERRLFQQLLELKRVQMRHTKVNEGVLVKRMVDEYNKESGMLGMRTYVGQLKFSTYEKYLYDQLRHLQSSQLNKLPNFKPSDDISKLNRALRHAQIRELPESLDSISDAQACSHSTHRCHHVVHAYTGVPCAAYLSQIRKQRNNKNGKINLPHIPANSKPTDNTKHGGIGKKETKNPLKVELLPSTKDSDGFQSDPLNNSMSSSKSVPVPSLAIQNNTAAHKELQSAPPTVRAPSNTKPLPKSLPSLSKSASMSDNISSSGDITPNPKDSNIQNISSNDETTRTNPDPKNLKTAVPSIVTRSPIRNRKQTGGKWGSKKTNLAAKNNSLTRSSSLNKLDTSKTEHN